ncbi:MBL fold metallo-hydrolase [Clostridium tarantellae]|uniref:MBL fold metallo-hydrolase n=1 Tax=Clostridium tarantellae TaxID=39493 RepID=A0A6I1MMB5_9CLOT|nr:MBL fold metallo-hydrolase RNA specificity domain-containing protein [Clostridium tarantellae]MPQ43382.1 MBL fold metallo-hydrolase [Clostridium tarantellae]
MNLEFLGGALEVGGSSILVNIDNKNILLDAGIRQGASKDPIPNFRIIQEYGGIDAIIISHAHLDHIGCLPLISKEYPNARIYMNNMTKDLVKVLLYDSLKIMNNRESEIPLYAEGDVESTLDRIFPINYEVTFSIFENMSITFYNAGHIAGASCIYLQSAEGAVFYSGDFSVFSQRTVEGAKIPKLRPDIAIVESTYGDKLHSNRDIEEDLLVEVVNDCISNKGKMIIPAFALGRAQEVILILKRAINNGKLKKVKIYVDGMVRDINRVYKNNPLYLRNSLGKKILKGTEPFYDDNIVEIKRTDNREEILSRNEAAVIISSSGMLTGGPSAFYAEKIAPMENGYIVITGYQDEEAPGRQILNLMEASEEEEKKLILNGLSVPVKCKVKKVGLSAHADKGEIKGLLQRITPKNIFLVHGNEEVINSLGIEISKEFIGRVFTPKCGEKVSINIKNPRKQFKKQFSHILNKAVSLTNENLKDFWEFLYKNYNERLFTIEELLYLWSGKENINAEDIESLKESLLESIYFENDLRRLFLFKARTFDEVALDLAPKELKQNELMEIIEGKFKDFNYKKASIMLNCKEVILNFDFPHGVSSSIKEVMENFKNETDWNISLNDKINNNAAEILARNLLEGHIIKKISFYPEKHNLQITINNEVENKDTILNQFQKETGWTLDILDGSISISSNNNATPLNNSVKEERFFKSIGNIQVEQNIALNTIDKAFENEKHKPYKKSIKNNHLGKYLELAFISPKIGELYSEKLSHICCETGWNIGISDKVNQNELMNLSNMLCFKNGIVLKKNPSYNGSNLSVTLIIINGEENFEKVKEEFEFNTGCTLLKA